MGKCTKHGYRFSLSPNYGSSHTHFLSSTELSILVGRRAGVNLPTVHIEPSSVYCQPVTSKGLPCTEPAHRLRVNQSNTLTQNTSQNKKNHHQTLCDCVSKSPETPKARELCYVFWSNSSRVIFLSVFCALN